MCPERRRGIPYEQVLWKYVKHVLRTTCPNQRCRRHVVPASGKRGACLILCSDAPRNYKVLSGKLIWRCAGACLAAGPTPHDSHSLWQAASHGVRLPLRHPSMACHGKPLPSSG